MFQLLMKVNKTVCDVKDLNTDDIISSVILITWGQTRPIIDDESPLVILTAIQAN